MTTIHHKVWRTIELGSTENIDKMRILLKEANIKRYWKKGRVWSDDPVTFSKKKEIVELVNVSLEELGFEEDRQYSYGEIIVRAHELGLKECVGEIGPRLFLEYKELPINEYLWVAVEPITNYTCDPVVYEFDNYDFMNGMSLGGRNILNWRWKKNNRFVFCLTKK